MPSGFFGERVRRAPDFLDAPAFHPQIELRKSFLEDQNAYWLNMMGRLKPGIEIGQAQASVNTELRQFITDQVGTKLTDELRAGIQNSYVQLTPGGRGLSDLRIFYAQSLRMLDGHRGAGVADCVRQRGKSVALTRGHQAGGDFIAPGAGRHPSAPRCVNCSRRVCCWLVIGGSWSGVLLAQWGVSLLVCASCLNFTTGC